MEFEEILKRRRSVRRFTDQQVREETIIQIMNEARHAPTWANAQETRIYVAAKNTAKQMIISMNSDCRENRLLIF